MSRTTILIVLGVLKSLSRNKETLTSKDILVDMCQIGFKNSTKNQEPRKWSATELGEYGEKEMADAPLPVSHDILVNSFKNTVRFTVLPTPCGPRSWPLVH